MLGFPDKGDARASPGSGWTSSELNHILQAHVVDGTLTSFGCVEWESDLFRGVMSARCYPFKLPRRRFQNMNSPVYIVVQPLFNRTFLFKLALIHTSQYLVRTGTYLYNHYVPSMYWYVLVL